MKKNDKDRPNRQDQIGCQFFGKLRSIKLCVYCKILMEKLFRTFSFVNHQVSCLRDDVLTEFLLPFSIHCKTWFWLLRLIICHVFFRFRSYVLWMWQSYVPFGSETITFRHSIWRWFWLVLPFKILNWIHYLWAKSPIIDPIILIIQLHFITCWKFFPHCD